LIDVIIAGLAGFRVAIFVVQEDGPWTFMERIRARLGSPKVGQIKPGALSGVIACASCASIWTTALAYVVARTAGVEFVAPIAAMGVALALLRFRA